MKRLLITLTILFSVLLSFSSSAEWKYIYKNLAGDEFFVENSSIKINNGYIYYWRLTNYLKPQHGDLSSKILQQLDCNVPRKQKRLSAMFYTGPMGTGNLDQISQETMNKEDWVFYAPDSGMTFLINYVCSLF